MSINIDKMIHKVRLFIYIAGIIAALIVFGISFLHASPSHMGADVEGKEMPFWPCDWIPHPMLPEPAPEPALPNPLPEPEVPPR